MSVNVRRLVGSACFLFASMSAVMFTLVAVSKISVLSPIAVCALVIYGGAAVAFFVAGRALFRRSECPACSLDKTPAPLSIGDEDACHTI